MTDELVFSTDTKVSKKKTKLKAAKKNSNPKVEPGFSLMTYEKKGRRGKPVTILSSLPMSDEESKEFCSKLKSFLACGGTYKESSLILNGDHREKIRAYFQKKNMKLKG